ncbi:putative exported oxidoreductase protein [Oceanicola granulosus HTCC2516]|uniref:Putative exported oxidoreductase protein n=1 Tax=Oceanicola granulosus (strain ATCC BAA-861 / DSM 15982 / KCTC 12143 / HTCC2516) TaxID=314256 RepID=Q2CKA9_OCEGH|nr:Gfo/Idh/MocA family oxidoreductase [Oceanicola granulosus]EAR52880.1 putative exported oxidoreductase protein [Oceanicola granulosus HTCC2516]
MVRAVMVGCGQMSNGWLTAIRETDALARDIELVGFVDLDPDLAAERAAQHGFTSAKTGSDLAAMLEALAPDVVFDIVVPQARRSVVQTAFAHGCDVLSEKPMANSLEEARELLALARETGRTHAIVQNRRHLAGIRRMKALIESGELGEITALHADFFLGPHFGGFREEMDHVLLLDMAIHTFDAARFLLPAEPTAVYCQETNPNGSWFSHGASANALFDCTDGATFSYRGSWCAEGAPTSWESSWRVIGTKGSVLWDGNALIEGAVRDGDDGFFRPTRPAALPEETPLEATGHAGVILDFITARAEGRAPLSVNDDNIKSLAMTFAAIESAETGRRVSISEETT